MDGFAFPSVSALPASPWVGARPSVPPRRCVFIRFSFVHFLIGVWTVEFRVSLIIRLGCESWQVRGFQGFPPAPQLVFASPEQAPSRSKVFHFDEAHVARAFLLCSYSPREVWKLLTKPWAQKSFFAGFPISGYDHVTTFSLLRADYTDRFSSIEQPLIPRTTRRAVGAPLLLAEVSRRVP